MESLMYWSLERPWLVSALCDLVTLLAAGGALALWLGRARTRPTAAPHVAAPPTGERLVGPRPEESPVNRLRPLTTAERPTTPVQAGKARTAVDRAVAAMAAWEATYRPAGRGLADLARLAEAGSADAGNRLRKVG